MPMIIAGIAMLVWAYRRKGREAVKAVGAN
jgi:phosphatidylglycerol:prolipoprotein diacylglycerol transferase